MRSTTTTRSIAAVGLAALVLLGVACSSTSSQVSDKIATATQKQLALDAKPKVTCPKDASAKKGSTFTCTVPIEGHTVDLAVVFTDDTHFTFTPSPRVFLKSTFVPALITELNGGKSLVKTLTCPGAKAVLIDPKGSVTCNVTTNAGTKGLVTVALDAKGVPTVTAVKPA